MNVENVRKFIEALRSGKYKKTKYKLRIGDCFCAYGLACEVSDLGKWIKNQYDQSVESYL
jgi:hypothetical protein